MKLDLTEQEINYVYALLLDQPAKNSRALLTKIEEQIKAVMEESNKITG